MRPNKMQGFGVNDWIRTLFSSGQSWGYFQIIKFYYKDQDFKRLQIEKIEEPNLFRFPIFGRAILEKYVSKYSNKNFEHNKHI